MENHICSRIGTAMLRYDNLHLDQCKKEYTVETINYDGCAEAT